MSSGLEQVRECRHHIDIAAIFGEAAQPGLLEGEMLLARPSTQSWPTITGLLSRKRPRFSRVSLSLSMLDFKLNGAVFA